MNESLHRISVEVNGKRQTATVPARLSLVDWLREELRLTGTHVGCEHGICGACSVMLDGEAVRACLMYAVQADGHRITTVEGLARPDGRMNVLQESFCEKHGLQCGYCTPGMLIAAQAREAGLLAGDERGVERIVKPDHRGPQTRAEDAANRLDARLDVLDDVGHFAHIEQPAEIAGRVLDFLGAPG